MNTTNHFQVLIIGGGSAGISIAAQLTRGIFNNMQVGVIEPSDKHFYQPLWTLVGGGVFPKEASMRTEASVMPSRVKWIQDGVLKYQPAENAVTTINGSRITYDYLVISTGMKMNWDKIPGLKEAVGHDGVCSNYSYETVDSTWETIKNFKGGNAVFTHPVGAVKCGGAPQKIMYLAEEQFRRMGVREKTNIIFSIANPNIFAIEKYRKSLEKLASEKNIDCRYLHELVEVNAAAKQAVCKKLDTGELVNIPYDMLHVTPPMGPHAVIAESGLGDKDGWVEVDKFTLQHVRHSNIFGVGDCSNLPTSKTAAAIRKQAPVVTKNIVSLMKKQPLKAKYDGYTACPIVTGYSGMILAEFDYNKNPKETFPFDQSKPRYSMWLFKKYALPFLYWHGMLKGRA